VTTERRRFRTPRPIDPIRLMTPYSHRVSAFMFTTLWLLVASVVFGLMLGTIVGRAITLWQMGSL
jgi:hypothetical protein